MPVIKAKRPGCTIPETARQLGLPEKLVRDAVRNGEIVSVKFAGLLRVPPAEIERIRQLFDLGKPTAAAINEPTEAA